MPIVIDNSPHASAAALAALTGERRMADDRLRNTLSVGEFDLRRRQVDQGIASSRLRDELSIFDRALEVEAIEQAQAQRQQAMEMFRQRLQRDVGQGLLAPEHGEFLMERISATGDLSAGFEFLNQNRKQVATQEADAMHRQFMAQAWRQSVEPFIQNSGLTAMEADNMAEAIMSGMLTPDQASQMVRFKASGAEEIQKRQQAQEEQQRAEMARASTVEALRRLGADPAFPEDKRDELAALIMVAEDAMPDGPTLRSIWQQAMALAEPPAASSTPKADAIRMQRAKEQLRDLDRRRAEINAVLQGQVQPDGTRATVKRNSAKWKALVQELGEVVAEIGRLEAEIGQAEQGGGQPGAIAQPTQPAGPAQPGVVQPTQEGGSARRLMPPEMAQTASDAVQQAIRELGPGANREAIKERAREIMAEQAQKVAGAPQ